MQYELKWVASEDEYCLLAFRDLIIWFFRCYILVNQIKLDG